VLLDPIKVTLVMPGLNAGGALSERGIPAAVVSKFLWERGLVVEKTGLYSFLVLFSMGITKGKWSTCSPSCWNSSAATTPTSAWPVACHRYSPKVRALSGLGARPVRSIARCYRSNATAKHLKRMYTVLPQIAMKPADAYDQLVREVEAVSIDALPGRIAAVMLVPYPPGIPLIMPGERFTESTRSIIDYLAFARTFDSSFPDLSRMFMDCNTKTTAVVVVTPSIASRNKDVYAKLS
jgi:arginine decarboxylase